MFKLLRYFSITSAIALIVMAVVLAMLFRQFAVNELVDVAERQNVALAKSFANTIWPRFSGYVNSTSGFEPATLRARPEIRQIHEELKKQIEGLPVLDVKIFNREGITVYSIDPVQIGIDKSKSPEFRTALREGAPSSKLSFRSAFNSFEGVMEDRNVIESYLPIRRGDGAIEGVLELYADVTPIMTGIQNTTTKFLVGLPLGFAALYALLFLIIRHADKALTKQYGDLRREIAERETAQEEAQLARDDMERLVRERTGALRAVMDSATDPIVSIDSDGKIEWFNSAAEKAFGYKAAEIIGSNITKLMPAPLREIHVESLALRDNGFIDPSDVIGKTRNLEGLRRDGTLFPLEISIGVSHSGGRTSYVGILRDISERRQIQERLFHSQKMEAIGQLTGGIAHEFNNLLTAIGGFGRMALRDVTDSKRVERCVEEVVKASDHAATLTRQMLTLGGKQESTPVEIGISEFLDEVRPMLKPVVNDDVEITVLTEDAGARVIIDPNQLRQAVLNLAINAAQVMPDGGRLEIRSRVIELDEQLLSQFPKASAGEFVALSVSDTGSGIDGETLQHIFEPFFTTKEPGVGTGLGLSTVYGLIEQAGGAVDVETEIGVGTTFNIYLPVTDFSTLEEAETPTGSPEEHNHSRVRTVLVAEDKAAVRELARLTLEDRGYRVLTAADGVEAGEIYRKHRGDIDVLLTDVAMPGKPGPKLARELLNRQPDLRIIFMSGHKALAEVKAQGAAPRSRFLQKPFSPEDLARMVEELIGT